jgi:riboflavin kinase/FMN adenylyltransferase
VERWRGVDSRPGDWPGAVVTIGVFDGVHRGHQVIIDTAVAAAHSTGLPSVALTFDPHPTEVLRPGTHPAVLTGIPHKAELVAARGIDVLCLLPFTLEFSKLDPDQFVRQVLVDELAARHVVIGANFRFGARAAGDVEELAKLGERYGFATQAVPLATDHGARFSSTAIRALVAAGDVEAAALELGRDHRVTGIVVRGDARGRELGYPTANLDTIPYAAVPGDGVYAGRFLRRDGTVLAAAISVGTNPTFAGTERRVEAFALDFDGDLYGESAGIEFTRRLRGQVRFEDVPALQAQMAIDVAGVEAIKDLLVGS